MNEAIKLTPITTHPKFKDGDGGGPSSEMAEIRISVLDNGYVITAMMDGEADIPGMPIGYSDVAEVYTDTATLLKRVAELVKA
tara:strand:- start:58737 stop:58985 length:249 start_codon:yes stop_codon:yes gene_type:complete